MIRSALVLLACTLTFAGPIAAQAATPTTATTVPSVSLPPELDRVLRAYEREWGARSPAGLAQRFTEDGFVLQSGHPPVRGRAGIARAFERSGGALALPDIGKFILLVRRERGGSWRIAADMDNGNGAR